MREESENVSDYVYRVIESYKASNRIDRTQEPMFRFCLKVLHLNQDERDIPGYKNLIMPPLNSLAADIQRSDRMVKEEIPE